MNDKPFREIIYEILTDHGLELERDEDGETFWVAGNIGNFHIPQDEQYDEEAIFFYYPGGGGEFVVGIQELEAKLPGYLRMIDRFR